MSNNLLKNAVLAFFNLAKCGAKLRTARKITPARRDYLPSHPCDDAARRILQRAATGVPWRLLVAAALVALGVCGRLLPHPPNFTPVAACAMFAGFLLGARAAIGLVLATMIASDLVIGGYDVRIMAAVYGAFVLSALIGKYFVARPTFLRVAGGSLGGSVAFFLATNGAVWAFSGMYALNWQGAVECFAAAVPFFRYTVMGDLFWATALFGAYALVLVAAQRMAPQRVAARRAD
jgi:hypothetical protein